MFPLTIQVPDLLSISCIFLLHLRCSQAATQNMKFSFPITDRFIVSNLMSSRHPRNNDLLGYVILIETIKVISWHFRVEILRCNDLIHYKTR